MKFYVAVTDGEWFNFLSGLSEIDEVNFWKPSGKSKFKTIQPGEPFLFKLHHPDNYITGGGFLIRSLQLPIILAWDSFGEKNGAPSFQEMKRQIEKYRKTPISQNEEIGCILLQDPFFFRKKEWIPVPENFSSNIPGKTYDTASAAGKSLWEEVLKTIQFTQLDRVSEPKGPVYGEPVPVRPRLGQGAFRALVTETYNRRCAITQEKALPVLDASHIKPTAKGGLHLIDNGLLLRTDIHRLFDKGYISVPPNLQILVSRKLKDDFDNGEIYYQYQGKKLWLPSNPDYWPNREFLEWHSDTVFQG